MLQTFSHSLVMINLFYSSDTQQQIGNIFHEDNFHNDHHVSCLNMC